MEQWKEYLEEFEKKVLIGIFESVHLKREPVPVRPGKLINSPFGEFIGTSFIYNRAVAFNYYGLFKLSTGLKNIEFISSTIKAPVVHFSAVKIEQVEEYCKPLIVDFVSFKKSLVALRWK